jgi:4-hydroxythreonine-4-phosphate dehydrogenase
MPIAAFRPLILSMGDPAGIGPEIVVKAFRQKPDLLRKVVVAGDVPTLQRALQIKAPACGSGHMMLSEIGTLEDLASVPPGCMAVVQACSPTEPVAWGHVGAQAGRVAADCIRFATRAALRQEACAMVTAPIHKESLAAAGVLHPGHTELLQALAAEHVGVDASAMPVRMMLSSPGLSTVLVSIHVSLRQAIDAVTTARVLQTIKITHAHFQRLGHTHARIAVAGLNPHSGEGGLFGREEIEVISPAVAQARAAGIDASGPHAPDTVFMRARQGDFDVVVAMYHDQGLIPVKLLGLEHGVNTTLGLPFVRTSPDHGTAFDLAGTGLASPDSLLAAIDAAMRASGQPIS